MTSVFIYPDRSKVANPYLHDLTTPTREVTFFDWSLRRALLGSFDVLHVHWPESIWNEQSRLSSLARGVAFVLLVRLMRLRGTAVVTTIHNLQPHDNAHPVLDRWFTKVFDRSVDRAHILAESARTYAEMRFGDAVPIDLVPMGSFVDNYDRPIRSGRQRRILHFGGLSRYKNTRHLIRVFSKASLEDWTLLVAGRPSSAHLETELRELADLDPRVELRLEQIDEADVPVIHGQAALAVLPFTAIENSSTVMLALSLGVPVLAPRMGALPDLASTVGADWLRLYDGPLSAEELEQAARWADSPRSGRPDLDRFSWDSIRAGLLESYRAAVLKKRDRT